ncbi:DUF6879 family protein [Sphaerisporangium flaviroseum]|uniref:DUF6879 family protein n=1 Tax=Sphaerisporangium flaviroseum TaxID=509199 RepID=UPI003CD071A2
MAGEQVRWLPRSSTYYMALPGCDFWQIGDDLVVFVFQSGDGEPAGFVIVGDDPKLSKFCASAFETVGVRARDHERYSPPTSATTRRP